MLNTQQPAVATMVGSGKQIKPGEVKHINIERAANGFAMEIRRKLKPARANQIYDCEAGKEDLVFSDVDAMCDHIRKIFGKAKAK